MKNVPLPKLIKWVTSGAIHPIVLFDEALMRELAVVELGPEYATKPFPWKFDEETTGKTFNWCLEGMLDRLRKYYSTYEHFHRDAMKISERVLYIPETTAEDIRRLGEFLSKPHPARSHTIDETIIDVAETVTIVETTTTTSNDPFDPWAPGIDPFDPWKAVEDLFRG